VKCLEAIVNGTNHFCTQGPNTLKHDAIRVMPTMGIPAQWMFARTDAFKASARAKAMKLSLK
jgi:hypothetical protein